MGCFTDTVFLLAGWGWGLASCGAVFGYIVSALLGAKFGFDVWALRSGCRGGKAHQAQQSVPGRMRFACICLGSWVASALFFFFIAESLGACLHKTCSTDWQTCLINVSVELLWVFYLWTKS